MNRRNVLIILGRQAKKSLQLKASINWDDINDDMVDYFNEQAITDWRNAFYPVVSNTFSTVASSWQNQMGTTFNLRHVYAEEFINLHTLKFSQPANETTLKDVQSMLLTAQENGWSIGETQSKIGQRFLDIVSGKVPGLPSGSDDAFITPRLTSSRLELIARTELTRAANAGSEKLFKSLGVQRHSWLTSIDGRERESHARANGQIVNVGENFTVGGFAMRYPGDMSNGAPVKEIANCRCTTIPEIKLETLENYENYDDVLAPDIIPDYQYAKFKLTVIGDNLNYDRFDVNSKSNDDILNMNSTFSKRTKDFLGREFTAQEIARISGIPHNFVGEIKITMYKNGEIYVIADNTRGIKEMVRSFTKDEFGNIILNNNSLMIHSNELGQGIGTNIFKQQVFYARQAGINSIQTNAARQESDDAKKRMNGYYTWARLGYDGALPSPVTINNQTANTVQELMKIPGGAEYWRVQGDSFDGVFDLSNGSTSMQVLTGYVRTKNESKAISIQESIDTGIELTDDDERILNNIWFKVSS